MRRTFSDHWYRIANLRLALRPGLSIRLHHYRGEPWYVLRERLHNGLFRVNPATYRFLGRLHVGATLDEVWRASVNDSPEDTPGQDEVFELVTGLYRANLVQVDGSVDEVRLIERAEARHRKPLAARLSELLFLRIPLCDPDPWLNRVRPLIDRVLSGPVLALLLGLVLWAGIELALAGPRAWGQAEHLLQSDNLLLLYAATLLTHLLHELAHAAASKRFGADVRTMGVMLLMLAPMPYVDLSSSWALRDRWQRVVIGGAGMLADLVTGAVATIVWAWTPPGLVNELAYNLMFTTVVYTVVFNINPLMRFDGYYMLSDAIGIPNLHQQAQKQFARWWRRTVLRETGPDDAPASARRRAFLGLFFLVSNVYRLSVMVGIVLFVADQYLGVGLVVAAAMVVTNFIAPLQKWLHTLRQPLFRFQQQRLLRRSAVVLGVVLAGLVLVPVPDSQVLDGVVEAQQNSRLYTDRGGVVERVAVQPGQWVKAGDLLVTLRNPELDSELLDVRAQRLQADAQALRSVNEGGADLDPIRERLRTLATLEAELLRQRAALVVRAPHDGLWVGPEIAFRVAGWVGRGAELGAVVDDRRQVFLGVLKQESSLALSIASSAQPAHVQVRIEGERAVVHGVTQVVLVPHSQSALPSAALSPLAGGAVPVLRNAESESHAVQAAEAFFLLRAELVAESARQDGDPLRHGRTSWLRIELPAKPLLQQAWTWANQYLQRRYQV
jgi:putative peptide zinc metalloprotease protein